MTFIGLLMIAVAVGLHAMWKRRVFHRTNEAGIQRFGSYSGKVRAQSFDRLLQFGALLMLTTGVLVISYVYVDTWGWVVIAPALTFVLFILIGS